MDSETLGKALEREHGEIDRGIKIFVAGRAERKAASAALADALDQLRHHIYFEEEHLFPPLGNGGIMAPLFVMRREHGEMWRTAESLTDGPTEEGCRALVAQLEAHNAKEERIVYTYADAELAPSVAAELVARLTSTEMPNDWVCDQART